MGSYPLDNKLIIDMDIKDDNSQKPNIYNKYLPFYELIKQQGLELFNEIRENLSRTIRLTELEPGFSILVKQIYTIKHYTFTFS